MKIKPKFQFQILKKIIFCYSSGKIPNEDICKQQKRLLSLGIKLELISVNEMTLNIVNNYPDLALEHLGINLYNSLNILSVDEFINDSNNGLSPSLNKIFSSRDNEIKEEQCYKKWTNFNKNSVNMYVYKYTYIKFKKIPQTIHS